MNLLNNILICLCFICGVVGLNCAQPVEIRTYHDDNKTLLKEIYFVKDSTSAKLCGPYKSYYISGSIETKGFYKDNLPDSIWTYYYESGNIKMRGTLKMGTNHGLWEYFFENGKLSMAGMIINSKREGTWKYYYENGNLKSQGEYKGDEKTGIWNYFYEEGSIKAQAFYQGDRGIYKEFYNDGKLKAEGLNIDNLSDSTWTFYHENGSIEARGNYKKGKRVGPWIYYYDNGVMSAEGTFEDGEKDGKWIYYHENGELSSEGALRQGKKEGYWKIFDENGQFKAEGVFEQNDGTYKEYYESGKIKVEGEIKDGKNHGLWTYYYEDGAKEGECQFVDGSGDYIGYYRDGTIKMKGQVKDGVNVGLWELYKGNGNLAGYYRPYYEDNAPVYKLVDKKPPPVERGDYVKPAYKYKSYKSRYFDPVINEYKGVILATNPLATFIGQLPLSFEYYIEERLGYEVLFTILRDPFYYSSESVSLNEVYNRGFNIALKQKFYHPEGSFGMFYFGHEARITSMKHNANVLDSTTTQVKQLQISTQETRFEYAIFIGDRWMQLFGERYKNNSIGFTIDAFLGLGFGYRLYEKKYPQSLDYDAIFKDLHDSKFVVSPRVGLNFGFIF